MEALMEWAKSQGVECARLLLGGLDGREMVAVEDLPAGSCFLRIPQHLLLRAELALQDPVYGKALTALAAEAGPSLDERFLMCLLMIIERCKGESSLWGPFLAVLPRTYEDPFWWADEELQLLKGTRVGNTVEYYNKGLQNLRTWRARLVDLHRELSGGQGPDVLSTGEGGWGMSEDAIKWAKSSVWSRAFNIPYLGAVGRPGIAMLPVADMLNHRPSQHVAWHTGPDGNQPFAFITHTPVPKGGTLYSNYGYKSNEELLVGYGFILDSNPANFFHVSLALENVARPVAEEEDGEQEQMVARRSRLIQRRALLQRLGLPTTHYLRLASPLPQALLDAACVCLMPDRLAHRLLDQTLAGPPAGQLTGEPAAADSAGQSLTATAALAQVPSMPSESVPGQIEVRGVPEPETATRSPAAAEPDPAAGDSSYGQSGLPEAGHAGVRSAMATCPPAVQLQVIATLKAQLRSKLAEIGSGSAAHDRQRARQSGSSSAARMALEYLAGQKQIAEAALADLSRYASGLLQSTSALTAPQRAPAWQAWWTSRLATSSSPAERAHPEAVLASHEVQCAAVMETPGVACGRVLTEAGSGTPVGLAASLGVPVEWCGWAWGLEVTRDVQQGAVLASLPASACLTAPDALALTVRLASLAYHHILVPSPAATSGGAATTAAGQGCAPAAARAQDSACQQGHGALVRHLAARVASSFAARLGLGGAMSDSIAELLEGSPAESLLQDECSDLQQRFAVVQPLLQAAIQEAAPGLAATSADGGPDGVLSVAQETLFGLMCWADVVIERCSFACIGAVAVAPVVSALPPALRGVAAEICWEESSESVQLVACCALPSGTVLNEALLNVGADAETLLVAYGPEAVAHAALLAKDVSIPDYLGGCMYEDGYELCIAVPESDQLHAEKTELLMASTLGSSHWLCASASPELLLAAIALIAAEAETLQAAGAQELLEALQACSSVAGRQSDGAAPASDACTPDAVQGQAGPRARDEAAINAAETRLAVAQQSFVMALLTGKASRKVACKQCRALLAASREELPDDSGSTTGIAQATVTQHFRQALTAEAAHDEGNLMLYGLFLYRKGLASLLDKAIATLTSSSSKHSGSQGSVKRKKRRH